MNQSDVDKMSTISSMLEEMYSHYHGQSPAHREETNEGEILVSFGTASDRHDQDHKELKITGVIVVSSAFASPSHQKFNSIDEALDCVGKWYMYYLTSSEGH